MPGTVTAIEAGLRGGAVALFLLLAVLSWRDARHLAVARYGTLFALCGIAFLIEAAPGLADRSPTWLIPIRVLSIAAPAVFQLWAAANFDDTFAPAWWRWLPLAGMAALALAAILVDRPVIWHASQIAALVLVGIGIWQALAGRAGDLVETRRRFRLVLALSAGVAIAGLILLAVAASARLRVESSLASAACLVALALAGALLGLGVRPRSGYEAPQHAAVSPARERAAPTAIDSEERALLESLQRVMDNERVYREERFGIAVLAERLQIPEYRLRRLINQRLGHRNFTGFVNSYRLAETIAALSDPGQAQVPILTIALDAGFQSLGPFNRAFKAETGVTPTEFRRDRVMRRAAE